MPVFHSLGSGLQMPVFLSWLCLPFPMSRNTAPICPLPLQRGPGERNILVSRKARRPRSILAAATLEPERSMPGLPGNSLLGEVRKPLFTLAALPWAVDAMLCAGQRWIWAGPGGGRGRMDQATMLQKLLGKLQPHTSSASSLRLRLSHLCNVS